jgi:hypothetical protein
MEPPAMLASREHYSEQKAKGKSPFALVRSGRSGGHEGLVILQDDKALLLASLAQGIPLDCLASLSSTAEMNPMRRAEVELSEARPSTYPVHRLTANETSVFGTVRRQNTSSSPDW